MIYRNMLVALALTTILIGNPALTLAQKSEEFDHGSPEDIDRLKEMILQLRNEKNDRPRVYRSGSDAYPIFTEPYDYDEQRRIKNVLKELASHAGDELWPLLLEPYVDDYALTFDADNRAESESVATLCYQMTNDLLLPFERHMPKVDLGNNYRLYPKSKWSPLGPGESIKKWSEKRPGKKLHELQIEICQMAIDAVPTMGELSEMERDRFVKGLKGEINEITRTGQPVVSKKRFDGEYHAIYSAKRIDEYRRKYGDKLSDPSKK